MIAEFTQGDPALFQAAGAMNRDAMADPELSKDMPTKPNHWQFMGRVFEELKKRG